MIYVIDIDHGQNHYYYIGQTGDRNYVTARPAFRRLSGHFEDRAKSTQNQIYKFIVDNIIAKDENGQSQAYDENIKQAVEEFLADSNISMHIYKVLPFNPGVNSKDHKLNVNEVVQLERNVIRTFINSRKVIMNKAQIKSTGPCPYPEILQRIKSDFNLE